jgi:acetyl-CoA carboxylase biotin carboxyl carrier protein
MDNEKRLADLETLIGEFKRSGLRELQARHGDFEIYLSLDADAPGLGGGSGGATSVQVARVAAPAVAPLPVAAPAPPAPAPLAASLGNIPEGAVLVGAPYLGTFYRSPKPGSPPYVEVGDTVSAESELCLVEVMKLFTAVRAGVAGTIVTVLANDGELVSADQPLFAVMPG